MSTIKDIRYENGLYLLKEAGGQAQFCEIIGKSQSQVSSILGANPHKGIGNKIAREIERAFSRPEGWLDVSQMHPEYMEIKPKAITPRKPRTTSDDIVIEDVELLYKCMVRARHDIELIGLMPSDEEEAFKMIAKAAAVAFNREQRGRYMTSKEIEALSKETNTKFNKL